MPAPHGHRVLIDPRAWVGCQPLQSPAFARQTQAWPMPLYGEPFTVGAFAMVYCGTRFGDGCVVAPYASVRENAWLGDLCVVGERSTVSHDCRLGNRVKLNTGVFLVGGTVVEDDVFIGPGATFGNDRHVAGYEWRPENITPPVIRRGARIMMRAVILPGVEIGEGAVVAAGAVVTRSVRPGATVLGCPAREVEAT